MKIGTIVQARMGSTRLPGKVMMPLGHTTVLGQVVARAKQIRNTCITIVATTCLPEDDVIQDWCVENVVECHRAPCEPGDVLSRYYHVATVNELYAIVRITADCPMLDPMVSSTVVDKFISSKLDYVSNVHPPTLPDGLDTEVITYKALRDAWQLARGKDREHVTSYVWSNPDKFRIGNVTWTGGESLVDYRWTLDTKEDLDYIRHVFGCLPGGFSYKDVLKLPRKRTLPREIIL